MGLDQYAYVAGRAGQRDEWWQGATMNPETKQFENPAVTQPRELAYWRKHPNLQGWMEQLWRSRDKPNNDLVQEDRWGSGFNGIELELTWQDLDRLEKDIKQGQLPATSGFFFGEDSDEYYRPQDLEFIKRAKAELFLGLKVFYNSSW